MAWIKTISFEESDENLQNMLIKLRATYPREYEASTVEQTGIKESIIQSHTLIPEAMFHAFSEFSALMSPDLPLERRHHEMIATVVSLTNSCHY